MIAVHKKAAKKDILIERYGVALMVVMLAINGDQVKSIVMKIKNARCLECSAGNKCR